MPTTTQAQIDALKNRKSAYLLSKGSFTKTSGSDTYTQTSCDDVEMDTTQKNAYDAMSAADKAQFGTIVTCTAVANIVAEAMKGRLSVSSITLASPYRRWVGFEFWALENGLSDEQKSLIYSLGQRDAQSTSDLMIASKVTKRFVASSSAVDVNEYPLNNEANIKLALRGLDPDASVFPIAKVSALTSINLEAASSAPLNTISTLPWNAATPQERVVNELKSRSDAWLLTVGQFAKTSGTSNTYNATSCESVEWDPTIQQELRALTTDQKAQFDAATSCQTVQNLMTQAIRARSTNAIASFALSAPFLRWKDFDSWTASNGLSTTQVAMLVSLGKRDKSNQKDLMIASKVTAKKYKTDNTEEAASADFSLASDADIRTFLKLGTPRGLFSATMVDRLSPINLEQSTSVLKRMSTTPWDAVAPRERVIGELQARDDAWVMTVGGFTSGGDGFTATTCEGVEWDPTFKSSIEALTADQKSQFDLAMTCSAVDGIAAQAIRTHPTDAISTFEVQGPYRRWKNFASWANSNALTQRQRAVLFALGKRDGQNPGDLMIASSVKRGTTTYSLKTDAEIRTMMKEGTPAGTFSSWGVDALSPITLETSTVLGSSSSKKNDGEEDAKEPEPASEDTGSGWRTVMVVAGLVVLLGVAGWVVLND